MPLHLGCQTARRSAATVAYSRRVGAFSEVSAGVTHTSRNSDQLRELRNKAVCFRELSASPSGNLPTQ